MIHYITTNGIGNAWVGNELHWVMQAGIPVQLHAMRSAHQEFHSSKWAKEISDNTHDIYPIPPLRLVGSTIRAALRYPSRFTSALCNSLFGRREHIRARLAGIFHLMAACDWIRRLNIDSVAHIHSQWIHSCGTIGMYGAWLLDVPFSFTGHAADLFRDRCALNDKIKRAKFIICISEFHRQFFLDNGARPDQLIIMYCGIDLKHFHFNQVTRKAGDPWHILSSGRLVEKKGFPVLINACALLRDRGERRFHCTIAGSGPQEAEVRDQILRLNLSDIVTITGKPLTQEDIPSFMSKGHIYCLPCVWARDNDVDGLPQMLMEAMACGLPAVSTRLVGIPDLIVDGKTGLLVGPNNAEQLADALKTLADDPSFATCLALAGWEYLEETFDIRTCLEPIIDQFRLALGMPVGNRAGNNESRSNALNSGSRMQEPEKMVSV